MSQQKGCQPINSIIDRYVLRAPAASYSIILICLFWSVCRHKREQTAGMACECQQLLFSSHMQNPLWTWITMPDMGMQCQTNTEKAHQLSHVSAVSQRPHHTGTLF